MMDRDLLIWILQRLHQLDEGAQPEVDYMTKLASIIDRTHPNQYSPNIAGSIRVRELLRGETSENQPQG